MARMAALSSEGDTVMKLMLDSEATSLSLVYRVPEGPSAATSNNEIGLSTTSIASSFGIPLLLEGGTSKLHHFRQHRFETLDLILPNAEAYRTLLQALTDLVGLHREERQRYSRNILVLHRHWSDLGKHISDSMSSAEWLVLCERMNVPMARADHLRLFRNYERQLNEGEGMLLSYVGEILEDLDAEQLNDPCDRIWSELVATDPIPAIKIRRADDDASLELVNDEDEEETISAVAFLSFIRSQQKQFSASLEDIIALIHTLNNQVTWDDIDTEGKPRINTDDNLRMASLDRLEKSRFVSFLLSDCNDIFDPSAAVMKPTDMSRPLSDYWIHTSHDTYLSNRLAATSGSVGALGFGMGGLQHGNNTESAGNGNRDCRHDTRATDDQMYLHALQRGVRCLELDLWDGVSGEPVIAKSQPSGTNNTIPLAVVLRSIRGFLKYNSSSYPIILRLENHCSFAVQEKVAHQITKILGSVNLLAKPDGGEVSESAPLPSPESLRGKVLIMGKRPLVMEDGAKIHNDDYDEENEVVVDGNMYQDSTYDEEELDAAVIGLNSFRPIKAASSLVEMAKETSLETVLEETVKAAEVAKQEATLAEARYARLQFEAAEAENLAAQLTQQAGLTPAEVKVSAAAAQKKCTTIMKRSQSVNELESNNTGLDDEGLEVEEFLYDEIKGSRKRYSSVVGEAILASEVATSRLQALHVADAALAEAESTLYKARQREKDLLELSRRAAVTARCDREHAESAKRRLCTVRDLLKKCEESANSARTVVVTATTESKISERRASEAETRASRALASADRDRSRADVETKKEEQLEEEASKLHGDLSESSNISKLARDRVEKAAAMLERVDDEIKLISASDTFRKECQQCPSYRHGDIMTSLELSSFPFLNKHSSKVAEMELCKDLMKEASSENTKADALCRTAQEKFEEKAQMWRIQADIASQVRKQADRSAIVAEELAEHAEEERNAATLRHVACKKAESNVQERVSNLDSVQNQLTEAERNANAAAALAVESRIRADHLAKELECATKFNSAIQAVQDCQVKKDLAFVDYEAARIVKEAKDGVAADTKRLLETNAEVYSSAVRVAAAASHRDNTNKISIQKATTAYERALLAQKQAGHAKALAQKQADHAKEKCLAAQNALEFKSRNSRMTLIPIALAELTWLHTTRYKYWEKTLQLPIYHVVSMSQQTVSFFLRSDRRTTQQTIRTFTGARLCRIFPSHITSSRSIFDPVKAWSMGCQMVSLDHQAPDEQFLVGEGRFRQNGSCGYVLKPSYLIKSSPAEEKGERWRIKVLRGNYLPKPEGSQFYSSSVPSSSHHCISPYVRITVLGGDLENPQSCTKAVKGNGLNPVWDEHEGVDMVVSQPSVAMLSVVVFDQMAKGEVDSFVAGAAIPIAHLRQGYRSVALFDASYSRSGSFAYASLLVHCQKIL